MLRIPSAAVLRGSGAVAKLPMALRGARAARSIVGRAELPQRPLIRRLAGAVSGPSVLTRPLPQAPNTTNGPIAVDVLRIPPSIGDSSAISPPAPIAHEPVQASTKPQVIGHRGVITAPSRHRSHVHTPYKPIIAPKPSVLRTPPEPPRLPTKAELKAQSFPLHRMLNAEVRLLVPKIKLKPIPAAMPDCIGPVYRRGFTSTIYQDKKNPQLLVKVSFAKDDDTWRRYQRMSLTLSRYYGEGSASCFRGSDGTSYLSMPKVPGVPITDLPDSAKGQAVDHYNILVQRLWNNGIVPINLHAGKVLYDPVTKRANPLAILRCKIKQEFTNAEIVINKYNLDYSTSPEIVHCKLNKNRVPGAGSDLRWRLVNRDGEVLKESSRLMRSSIF